MQVQDDNPLLFELNGYNILYKDIHKNYVFQYSSWYSRAKVLNRHYDNYHLSYRIQGHPHTHYLHHNLLLPTYMVRQEYNNPKYLPFVLPDLENTFYLNVVGEF